MLNKDKILELLELLNTELKLRSEIGEIGLVGGAVMCLVYNARASTRDVDAVFEPAQILREIIAQIAAREGLASDWLNDAAKGFLMPGFLRQDYLVLSNLRVWVPEARYMLAMKCISARWDSADRDDVIFLLKHLNLTKPIEVYQIIQNYYPKKQILPKTQFFIEEVLAG